MQLSVQFLLLLSSVTASLAARQHFELYDQVQSTYLNSKSELAVNSLRARDNEDALTIAQKHVEKIAPGTQYKLVPDHYTDDDTGVTHAYFVQTYNGVEIENTQINVNVCPPSIYIAI